MELFDVVTRIPVDSVSVDSVITDTMEILEHMEVEGFEITDILYISDENYFSVEVFITVLTNNHDDAMDKAFIELGKAIDWHQRQAAA